MQLQLRSSQESQGGWASGHGLGSDLTAASRSGLHPEVVAALPELTRAYRLTEALRTDAEQEGARVDLEG